MCEASLVAEIGMIRLIFSNGTLARFRHISYRLFAPSCCWLLFAYARIKRGIMPASKPFYCHWRRFQNWHAYGFNYFRPSRIMERLNGNRHAIISVISSQLTLWREYRGRDAQRLILTVSASVLMRVYWSFYNYFEVYIINLWLWYYQDYDAASELGSTP